MISVSDITKIQYHADSAPKRLFITFTGLSVTYDSSSIIEKSFSLSQKLMENGIDFVGCKASTLTVELRGVDKKLVGEKVEAYIEVEDGDRIQVFTGFVDASERTTNRNQRKITAYDAFYSLGKKEVTAWYNNHFDTDLINLFKDLMKYVGMEYVEPLDFVNENMPAYCSLTQTANAISALTIIKSICQICGVCGVITPEGKFRSVIPKDGAVEEIPFYRKCVIQEYTVKSIDNVLIRESDSDGGTLAGDAGDNTYIVQGNMFAYDFSELQLEQTAQALYERIAGFSFIPFDAKVNGLPYLQCGDRVTIEAIDEISGVRTPMTFTVLERKLSETQANVFVDNLEANGDELQNVYISDIGTDLESLKTQMGEYSLARFDYTNTRMIEIPDDWKLIFDFDYDYIRAPFFLANIIVQTTGPVRSKTISATIDGEDASIVMPESLPTNIYVKYVLDDFEFDFYPVETYIDGEHTLALFFPIKELNSTGGKFEVFMKASGLATIARNCIKASLIGQGKAYTVEWDGKLEFEETFEAVKLAPTSFGIQKIAGRVDDVYITTYNTTTISESIGGIRLNTHPIGVQSVVEEITAVTNVRTTVVSTKNKLEYSYDRQFVEDITEFALRTDYRYAGADAVVDVGYMTMIDIDTGVFDEVQGIEIIKG